LIFDSNFLGAAAYYEKQGLFIFDMKFGLITNIELTVILINTL